MVVPITALLSVSLLTGLYAGRRIKGSVRNFFVGGNVLPAWVLIFSLCGQAIELGGTHDSAQLGMTSGFWAAVVLPVGIGLSLIVTGLAFAKPLHRMRLLSLPDFFRQRFDMRSEVLVAVLSVVSFTILIAGNLAGIGIILERTVGLPVYVGVPLVVSIVTVYGMTGGLFAVTWNDILQGGAAIVGIVVAFVWLVANEPGAIAHGLASARDMTDPGTLRFWATLGALALGDVVALDFMERVFAARTPEAARTSCVLSGTFVVIIGLLVGLIGVAIFPLAPGAEGHLVTAVEHVFPPGVAMLFIVGLVAAGVSTVDGCIMACSVAISRNILQPLSPKLVPANRLLFVARLTSIPVALVATIVAIVYPSPVDLLILAFDVVFAGCFVPLLLGIYWRRATANAAFWAIVIPSILRVAMEFGVKGLPPEWNGLQTLVPPVLSVILFVALSRRSVAA